MGEVDPGANGAKRFNQRRVAVESISWGVWGWGHCKSPRGGGGGGGGGISIPDDLNGYFRPCLEKLELGKY